MMMDTGEGTRAEKQNKLYRCLGLFTLISTAAVFSFVCFSFCNTLFHSFMFSCLHDSTILYFISPVLYVSGQAIQHTKQNSFPLYRR